MFYRLSSLGLVCIGLFFICTALMQGLHLDTENLWTLSAGMSTFLVGILNFIYLYESPQSYLPKIILLGTNGLYIGYCILFITNHALLNSSYISLALVLITSILILNKKV